MLSVFGTCVTAENEATAIAGGIMDSLGAVIQNCVESPAVVEAAAGVVRCVGYHTSMWRYVCMFYSVVCIRVYALQL